MYFKEVCSKLGLFSKSLYYSFYSRYNDSFFKPLTLHLHRFIWAFIFVGGFMELVWKRSLRTDGKSSIYDGVIRMGITLRTITYVGTTSVFVWFRSLRTSVFLCFHRPDGWVKDLWLFPTFSGPSYTNPVRRILLLFLNHKRDERISMVYSSNWNNGSNIMIFVIKTREKSPKHVLHYIDVYMYVMIEFLSFF